MEGEFSGVWLIWGGVEMGIADDLGLCSASRRMISLSLLIR